VIESRFAASEKKANTSSIDLATQSSLLRQSGNRCREHFVVATRREDCASARVFSYAPVLQVIAIPSAAQIYRQFATSGRFRNDSPDSALRESQVVETLATFLILRLPLSLFANAPEERPLLLIPPDVLLIPRRISRLGQAVAPYVSIS
jgi:hypothetical protein